MSAGAAIAVCVPACNEAERLPFLLDALAAQTLPATIVIALNNTSDASRDVIAFAQRRHPSLRIMVDDVHFPAAQAHAGSARRRAMDVGLEIVGDAGWLISTDADTRPPSHWIAANANALGNGLDIVGGQIRPDENEEMPHRLRVIMAVLARYWADVRAIEDAIDPVAWDPPPRHGDHTGASLALSAAVYRSCGGVPAIATGEDRAMVRAVQRIGGRLGHPSNVWTRVSTRLRGRAEAGMAQEMSRLMMSDVIALPDFSHWRERARWRRSIRDRFGAAALCEREEALPPMPSDLVLPLDETAAA